MSRLFFFFFFWQPKNKCAPPVFLYVMLLLGQARRPGWSPGPNWLGGRIAWLRDMETLPFWARCPTKTGVFVVGIEKRDAGRGKEGRKRRKGPDATVPAKIQSAVYDQFTSRIGQPYRPVPAMNCLVSASTMRKVGTEWHVPGLGRVYLTVQPRMSQVCVPCAKREENKIPELNPRTITCRLFFGCICTFISPH